MSLIKSFDDTVEIHIIKVLITSKPGCKQPCLILKEYVVEDKLCVVSVLNEYILRTSLYRNHDQLFLSLESPYGVVSTQTISRWLKNLLSEAKIDISMYKAHSFRHASTSKAFQNDVPIDIIFSSAGWTSKSATFGRFYNKPIQDKDVYANSVLS